MNLCIVTHSFEHGRRFCQAQGLNFRKAILVSTDARWTTPRGFVLDDKDALVMYGPYYEGRYAHSTMDYLEACRRGNPFEFRVYDYHELIPWPQHILTMFGVNNERR